MDFNIKHILSLAKEEVIFIEYTREDLFQKTDGIHEKWKYKNPVEFQKYLQKFGECTMDFKDNYFVCRLKNFKS